MFLDCFGIAFKLTWSGWEMLYSDSKDMNVTNKIHSTFSQSVFENAFKLCFPFMGPVDVEKT